jgi:hypothetical protein
LFAPTFTLPIGLVLFQVLELAEVAVGTFYFFCTPPAQSYHTFAQLSVFFLLQCKHCPEHPFRNASE